VGAAGVPRAVVAALAAEVSALPIPAQALVQGAAKAGDPFDLAIAAAAADMREDEALTALDAVVAADLVRPTEEPWRFAFRHPLVRRAVYETAGAAGSSPRTPARPSSSPRGERRPPSARITSRARLARATWLRPSSSSRRVGRPP